MNDRTNSSTKSPLLPCQEPVAGASCQNGQGNPTRKADSGLELLAIAACIILFVFQALWTVGSNLLSALPKPPADEATIMARIITEASASASPTEASLDYSLWVIRRHNAVENLTAWVKLTEPLDFDDWKWLRIGSKHTGDPKPLSVSDLLKQLGNMKPKSTDLIEALNWEDITITEASNRMDLLQQFILPLLYGWIGALAYILKSEQNRRSTDRKENTLWDLRMLLGMVAGLAIGWFFKPPNTEVNGFGLVSPFALAFLAGYSVDLLSNAMDRVVSSLQDRIPKAKEESSTKTSGSLDAAKSAPAAAQSAT
jgi:hypothetical protein